MRVKFPGTNTLNAYVVRPNEVKPEDLYGYKIIAKIQSVGYWCAYMGDPSWTDEEVAASEDAIPEKTAALLFPSLAINRIYYS